MITNLKEFYEEKAGRLYKKSDMADEAYEAELRRFEMKEQNGKNITKSDVYRMLNGMKNLHESVEIHKQAVEAKAKAERFK